MFGFTEENITYWYADELPYWIAVTIVCALVSIILSPPVLQLCFTICFSFMIDKLIQVRKPSQKSTILSALISILKLKFHKYT